MTDLPKDIGGIPVDLLADASNTVLSELYDLIAEAMNVGSNIAGASCEEEALEMVERFTEQYRPLVEEARTAMAFVRVRPLIHAMSEEESA